MYIYHTYMLYLDGGWSDYSEWLSTTSTWKDRQTIVSTCDLTFRSRSRTCTNPTPSTGGQPCTGIEPIHVQVA